jgi:ribonucleoside-diphosphate reductase alpha chain
VADVEPIAAAMTAAPPSIREPADADDRGPARAWGSWQAPPRRRRNITSTARLPGAGKVHLTIDLDNYGQAIAIWVEVHKEGSIVRGMLDAVAALASQGLQHGASIHEVADRMIGVRFEPDGAVEGHETVKECLSIVDLLGRMIAAEMAGEPGGGK